MDQVLISVTMDFMYHLVVGLIIETVALKHILYIGNVYQFLHIIKNIQSADYTTYIIQFRCKMTVTVSIITVTVTLHLDC